MKNFKRVTILAVGVYLLLAALYARWGRHDISTGFALLALVCLAVHWAVARKTDAPVDMHNDGRYY